MEYDTVIVRYGEIFLKSGYVRRQFTLRLVGNITHALASDGLDVRAYERRHRIFLEADEAEAAAERSSRVFGVRSASPAVRVRSGLDELTGEVVEYAGGVLAGGGSFAVEARRAGDYPTSSMELEKLLGAAVKTKYGNPVDLTNPDHVIGVEVHGDAAFLYSQVIRGVGGLPYGTQGSLAALVGDARGALAAWMMMRRGCSVLLVGSGGYAGKLSRYSNPDVKVSGSLGEAMSAGACGVVTGETVDGLDFGFGRGLGVPVYRPLLILDSEGIDGLIAEHNL